MKKANDILRRNVVSIDGDDFSVMDFLKTYCGNDWLYGLVAVKRTSIMYNRLIIIKLWE